MEINLRSEKENQLSQIAALEGKGSLELAREVFIRGLADEARFISAVETGQAAARRGDFVEASEVWAGVEQTLRS